MGLYINYFITGFFFLVIGIPILLPFTNNLYNLDWNYTLYDPENSFDGLGK
jgi:hypothetical protein